MDKNRFLTTDSIKNHFLQNDMGLYGLSTFNDDYQVDYGAMDRRRPMLAMVLHCSQKPTEKIDTYLKNFKKNITIEKSKRSSQPCVRCVICLDPEGATFVLCFKTRPSTEVSSLLTAGRLLGILQVRTSLQYWQNGALQVVDALSSDKFIDYKKLFPTAEVRRIFHESFCNGTYFIIFRFFCNFSRVFFFFIAPCCYSWICPRQPLLLFWLSLGWMRRTDLS